MCDHNGQVAPLPLPQLSEAACRARLSGRTGTASLYSLWLCAESTTAMNATKDSSSDLHVLQPLLRPSERLGCAIGAAL